MESGSLIYFICSGSSKSLDSEVNMGGLCSKGVNNSTRSDAEYARQLQQQEIRMAHANGSNGNQRGSKSKPRTSGTGILLGGNDTAPMSQDDRRAAQAAAAEARAKASMQRGIGDSKKAEQLNERAQKDEIIGRITHLYNVNKESLPLGLGVMTIKQLNTVHEKAKKGQF